MISLTPRETRIARRAAKAAIALWERTQRIRVLFYAGDKPLRIIDVSPLELRHINERELRGRTLEIVVGTADFD
jgi:hypothetical protein